MTAAMGYAGQLGIDTASPVTQRFDFQSETFGIVEELKDTSGIRGTRSRIIERLRTGTRKLSGGIRFQPNVAELRLLLPWALGGTPTGSAPTTYPLADPLTSRYVVVDRTSKVFTYTNVYVNKLTVKGTQGEPLDIELDLLGTDETVGNSGTFPALTIDDATTPFMFFDLALTINSVSVNPKEFTLTIDNKLVEDRFLASQTLVSAPPQDRIVTLDCNLPYGDYAALYGAGGSGVGASAAFTNGANTLTFTMAKVAFPRESPHVEGRTEIMYPVKGQAMKSGSTMEVVTTL